MNKEELLSRLAARRICARREARGATTEELAELSRALGVTFPLAYREFLLAVGHGAGAFMRGTDIFIPALANLKSEALDLVSENEYGFTLPADAFVFCMHQGYQLDFFRLSEGDDPPVYHYNEDKGPPVRAWDSFSEFLEDFILFHARLRM